MPTREFRTTISLSRDIKARLVNLFEDTEEGFRDWDTNISELIDYLQLINEQ